MRVKSREELEALRKQYRKSLNSQCKQILVCAGTGCMAGGSIKIYERFKELIEEKGLKLELKLEKEVQHPHFEKNNMKQSNDSSGSISADKNFVENKNIKIEHKEKIIGLKKSGCHGFCEMGPLVRIEPSGTLYKSKGK